MNKGAEKTSKKYNLKCDTWVYMRIKEVKWENDSSQFESRRSNTQMLLTEIDN